jgi:O-antigen ligase
MIEVSILAVAALTCLRRLPHIRLVVLTLLLYRYIWFGIHGVAIGRVPWHPLFGNQDAYGSLMAMGLASSVALAMGATERRFRNAAIFAAVICVGGVVSSFARGAFLAGAIGLGFIWLRATGRRLAYAGTVVLLVGATVTAATIFSSVTAPRGGGATNNSSFWAEIASIQESISNPEDEERREVWRIGWQVFVDNPILGVGTGSWAPYAGETYHGNSEVMGERFRNRNSIYGRQMHSIYLQLLAEQGLVGTALFFWIFIDYLMKCRTIRRQSHKEDCSLVPGFRTRMVVTAFEATLVVSLVAGIVYNVLGVWFFALMIAQALFYRAWAEQRAVSRREGSLAAR